MAERSDGVQAEEIRDYTPRAARGTSTAPPASCKRRSATAGGQEKKFRKISCATWVSAFSDSLTGTYGLDITETSPPDDHGNDAGASTPVGTNSSNPGEIEELGEALARLATWTD